MMNNRPNGQKGATLLDFQHNESGSNSFCNSLENAFFAAKEGLNGVLFAMSKRNSSSKTLFFFGKGIDFLQMAAFVLPATKSLNLNFPAPVATLAESLAWVQFGARITDFMGVLPAVACSLALVLIELANLLYVGYTWAKRDFKLLWTIKLLRYTMTMFVGVAYIPIVSILSNVLTCNGISDELTCDVLKPFVVVTLLAFVLVACLISLTLFDPRPLSKSPGARPHSRINMLHILAKTALTVVFSLVQGADQNEGIIVFWAIFTLLWTVPLGFLFTWYQPYFHQSTTLAQAILSNCLGWISLCTCFHVFFVRTPKAIGQLEGEMSWTYAELNGSVTTSVLFGGIFLMIPLSWSFVHFRWHSLVNKSVSHCLNVFEAELKCRLELQGFGSNHISLIRKTSSHILKDRGEHVHKLYLEAAMHFPASGAVHVFHAHMLLDCLPEKSNQIRRATILAEKRGLRVDFGFTIYKTKRLLEENIDSSSDVVGFIKAEKFLQEALFFDKQCSSELVEFWSELAKKKPNNVKVRNLARLVAFSSANAKQRYLDLLKLNPFSISTLKLFGSFLLDILNDSDGAHRVMQKAMQLERDKNKKGDQSLNHVQSEEVGVILLSGGSSSLDDAGEILSVNSQASKILNQDSSAFVGAKVQTFLAPPFCDQLSTLLEEFFEKGNDGLFDKVHQTFLIGSDGVCTAINLRLKPLNNASNTFQVFLLFTPREGKTSEDSSYVLVNRSKEIIGFGKDCPPSLRERDMDVATSKLGMVRHMTVRSLTNFQTSSDENSIRTSVKRSALHISRLLPEFAQMESLQEESGDQLLVFPGVVESSPMGNAVVHLVKGEESNSATNGPRLAQKARVSITSETSLGTTVYRVYIEVEDVGMGETEVDSNCDTDYDESDAGLEMSASVYASHKEKIKLRAEKKEGKRLQFGVPNATSPRSASKAGSVASSVNSQDRLRVRAMQLRRALLADARTGMDSTLAKYWKLFQRITIVVIGLAVFEYFYSRRVLDNMRENLETVNRLGLRRTKLVDIAFETHSLILRQESLFTEMDEQIHRDQLMNDATALAEADKILFFQRAELDGGEILGLYDDERTDFFSGVDGQFRLERLKMYDATLRYTSLAKQLANFPLGDFRYNASGPMTMLGNLFATNQTLMNGLMKTTDAFAKHAQSELEGIRTQFMVLSVVICSVVFLALVLTIYPLIGNGGKIENSKEEILQVFHDIPKDLINQVSRKFTTRLLEVHGEFMEVEAVSNEEEDAQRSSGKQSKNSRRVLPMPTDKKGKSFTSRGAERTRAKKSSKSKKNSKSEEQPIVSLRKVAISVKLASLLLLSLGFFIGIVMVISKTKDQTFGAGSTASSAGIRRTWSALVSHRLRLFLASPDIDGLLTINGTNLATDLSPGPLDIEDAMTNLVNVHKMIMGGDDSLGIVGVFEDNDDSIKEVRDMLTLYTEAGCHLWGTGIGVKPLGGGALPSLSDCESAYDGMMGSGLHVAVLQFQAKVRDFVMRVTVERGKDGENSLQQWLGEPSFLELLRFEHDILRPQLSTAVDVHREVTEYYLHVAENALVYLLVLFVLSAFSAVFFLVRGVLHSLDLEIKRSRSLLLVIPEDIFHQMPGLQRFLLDQFDDNQSVVSDMSSMSAQFRNPVLPTL